MWAQASRWEMNASWEKKVGTSNARVRLAGLKEQESSPEWLVRVRQELRTLSFMP